MRTLETYYRMMLLAAALLLVPLFAKAQNGLTGIARERDSLINVISKESDHNRLGKLYLELAYRYLYLYQYNKLSEAAEKAVLYSNESNDTQTLFDSYLLLGHNYIVQDVPVKAIESYLSARGVLERKFNDDQRKYNDEQRSKGVEEKYMIPYERPNSEKEADADIVTEIGLVYFNRGHYPRAIDNFGEANTTFEEVGNADKALNTLSYLAISYYMKGDSLYAADYYERLLVEYKKRNDWENMRMVYQRLNEIYITHKMYDKVYKYNRELYNECTKHNNVKESLNALNNVAYSYVCMKEYDKAIKYYHQLLEIDPIAFGDDRILAGTYTSLGLCYQNMNNIDLSLVNLKKADEIRQKYLQWKEASTVENILALIYLKEDDFHNAVHYAESCVEFAEKSGDVETRKQAYLTYKKVLEEKGEYKKSSDYYQKYLSLKDSTMFQATMEERRKAEDLKSLIDGETSYNSGLFAKEYSDLESETSKIKADSRQKEIELLRIDAENQKLLRDKAMQDLMIMKQKQKELLREKELAELERQNKLNELELQRRNAEQREKEKENALLRSEKEKQDLMIANQKAESGRMRMLFYLASAVVLFFLVIFVLLRKKNRKLKEQQAEIESKNADLLLKNEEITNQKESLQAANNEIMLINNELSKQKAIIEEANKSMTDSIVYAKRIQTAVCPSPTFLSAFSFDYFLFFRPRDIVSGDYYWFYSDDKDHVFVVAADCTGHGVPGAFMSMLGVSLFNKIVAERQIIEPDLILNTLRNEVKNALHQESINSKQKDGMDLSLVRIDTKTNMIHFAAANNNGYLLQHYTKDEEQIARQGLAKPEHLRELEDGSYLKLSVMPSDSMPIGVYIREKESFTKTSYQLRKGDTFYLTSDGYVDQFGGKYGRKFLSKNFQQLLLNINSLDMNQQYKEVVDTHENWIGATYDQLDDIIVIGVRV